VNKVLELYGVSTLEQDTDWEQIVALQQCPYLNHTCTKIRKSQPEITIGSCTVLYGQNDMRVMICPNRLLAHNQIFLDCIHLLTLHEPGNELHIIPEVTIPGGVVDYFLLSAQNNRVIDFVAIELQTLDTTGTVWPARQQFLHSKSVIDEYDVTDKRNFGMNWKMTAKTILVQLNHKIRTLENLNKHLVLVLQNHLLAYMQKEFAFDHIGQARLGDSAHFHSYNFVNNSSTPLKLELTNRISTNADGISKSLDLRTDPNIKLDAIIDRLEAKMSESTLLQISIMQGKT